ncbi:MAG: sulfide-dependent adenosine diphosphate thiazole synthase [Dehalococcoidales bacterium]|nr:sulfide-dependent adenosine diphosphate thiazole synthase [Dehalococcoidales bacterium]
MEKFSPVGEREITQAIVTEFAREFNEMIASDCIIVGGGPSGLVAGRDLARAGKKVVIVERNNYLGGGFWSGGFLMPKVTVRHPAEKVLDEIGVPYKTVSRGLVVCDAPHACSSLISAACAAGVKILNMVMLEDIVIKEGRVCGVVINWSPIASLPRQVAALDPIAIEARVIIDATGHDATVVKKLEQRGLLKCKGEGAMWIEKSEDLIVEHTGECYPGLIVTGMAVGTVWGLPRMGPTFGSMFLSGRRAAEIAMRKIEEREKQQ